MYYKAGMDALAETILQGGVVVYPTETLYALGCSAFDADAARRVARIKNRSEAKPLPLVVGHRSQLALVTPEAGPDILRLADLFWPGPLSLLVTASPELAPLVKDHRGLVSVRVTPHPVAASLCLKAGVPLVATSANISGQPPAHLALALSPALTDRVDGAWLKGPEPAGVAPSTVARPLGARRLEILRSGAVGPEALERSGFTCLKGESTNS